MTPLINKICLFSYQEIFSGTFLYLTLQYRTLDISLFVFLFLFFFFTYPSSIDKPTTCGANRYSWPRDKNEGSFLFPRIASLFRIFWRGMIVWHDSWSVLGNKKVRSCLEARLTLDYDTTAPSTFDLSLLALNVHLPSKWLVFSRLELHSTSTNFQKRINVTPTSSQSPKEYKNQCRITPGTSKSVSPTFKWEWKRVMN